MIRKLSLVEQKLEAFHNRALRLNQDDRITGNALISAVDAVISEMRKNPEEHSFPQRIIDQLIYHYSGLPKIDDTEAAPAGPIPIYYPEFFGKLLKIIRQHQEEI
jgi:hypothetical protein